jgi:hypothetical protein
LPALLGAGLLAWFTQADRSYAQNQPDRQVFQVSVRNEEFVGNTNERQVQRVYVSAGTNQFAFTVPESFRADASNPQKIVLSDINYLFFLTVRFSDNRSEQAGSTQMQVCRSLALSRFPGAVIVKESVESAGGRSGPAFDLQWKNSAGAEQSARVAFVPSSAGVIEFDLLTRTSKFDDGRSFFAVLLASFRSNAAGKLRITPVSDKS